MKMVSCQHGFPAFRGLPVPVVSVEVKLCSFNSIDPSRRGAQRGSVGVTFRAGRKLKRHRTHWKGAQRASDRWADVSLDWGCDENIDRFTLKLLHSKKNCFILDLHIFAASPRCSRCAAAQSVWSSHFKDVNDTERCSHAEVYVLKATKGQNLMWETSEHVKHIVCWTSGHFWNQQSRLKFICCCFLRSFHHNLNLICFESNKRENWFEAVWCFFIEVFFFHLSPACCKLMQKE